MAMNVAPSDGSGEDEVNSTINTTPMVDVMLVLLIIFLITVPVVIKSTPVLLPVAENIATITTPENVVIAVDVDGSFYWNDEPVADTDELFERLSPFALLDPQPEIHIRGDRDGRYEGIGRVVVTCQRAGILKIGFITNPFEPE